MTLWRLVRREIRHRKLSFALAVVAVMAPVGALVGTVSLLRVHDLRTGEILEAKLARTATAVHARQAEAAQRAAELGEAFRKIMLRFGYNLLILPAEEDIARYQLQRSPSSYMAEETVRTLAESGIMTVRHLLPVLRHKQILIFNDQRCEVFLIGTRGEVPLAHRAPKQPLLAKVPPGKMIIGHEVSRALGLKVGSKAELVGRQFEVTWIYESRGDDDDVSVWLELGDAQELLGKPGKISGIQALSCICPQAELEEIKKQIVRILPGTQVHVSRTEAVVRYEARARAAEEAKTNVRLARLRGQADVERERESRARLRGQVEALGSWLAPVLVVAGAAAIALLTLVNVRERKSEIGILLALGVRSGKVLSAFLAKALLTGLLGALLGYAAGFAAAAAWGPSPALWDIFDPTVLLVVLAATPLLSALACWAPALLAARQDPAVVLRES